MKYECTCLDKTPKPSMEHERNCPIRINFFGCPCIYDGDELGQIWISDDGRKFEWTEDGWQYLPFHEV
jgi:hypothetical protein